MNVRTANENDAEAISLLMDQLGYQASAKLIADKIKQFRNSTNDAVYVTENDKVVGAVSCHIISLFHQKGACGRSTGLVVDESQRNLGIGKALVEAAEKYFKLHECIRFEVTSGNHRTKAHKFYLSCGYKEDERRFIKDNT